MMQERTDNIKERLLSLMKEISALWTSHHVAFIICVESDINAVQSMYGYNTGGEIGTLLCVSTNDKILNNILAYAWGCVDNQSTQAK